MIKVLVVDDSAVVRKILSEELAKSSFIEVVGTASDPYVARDKIVQLEPDVITLDIEMPRMDGLSFLEKLMRHFPLPVVIVSSLTPQNSDLAIRALELGAVELICKPGSTYSTPGMHQLIQAIRSAAVANVKRIEADRMDAKQAPRQPGIRLQTTDKIIAIGASTGGTHAIEKILTRLPATTPGTLIVQHMPEGFTAAFAKRLDQICAMQVHEAKDGDDVVPGTALVAPGGSHMLLERNGSRYNVRLKDGPPVHHQKPSVDVLFHSVARNAGRHATGVILTGMGSDGAKGMKAMRDTGSYTLAQDEKSCIVFGMPKQAIQTGGVLEVASIDNMAERIVSSLQQKVKGVA